MQITPFRTASAVALAALWLCPVSLAQSKLVTDGEVLAASGNPVPGIPHALYPNSTTNWVNPVVDENGNVLFAVSTMVDDGSGLSGLALPNNRAYIRGSSAANVALYLRASDAAPNLPGLTLNTATGPGISTAFRVAKNGKVLFGSFLTSSSTDDTVLYAGDTGAWQIVGREGDVAAGAPGVAGCTYASGSAFNSPTQTATGLNANGDVLFKARLQGGDVAGTSNDDIWYVGQPGALQVMLREGGTVGTDTVASLGFSISRLNAAGQVLHDQRFSTAPANTDQTVLLYTPGLGNSILLREGDAAPGTVGATFNNSSNTWSTTNSQQTGTSNFNSSARYIVALQLLGGDVVAGVNDMALYICSTTGHTMVIRRGDAAPGLPGLTMDTTHTTGTPVSMAASPCIADNGRIAFRGRVADSVSGTVTAANDTAVWAGAPGALQLVYREGDVAPGTGGQLFGDAAATIGPLMNAAGVVLLQNRLGGVNDALYSYDANTGGPLELVALAGDVIEVSPGVFKTVSGFGNVSADNSNGSPMMFGADGVLALRVTFTDNTNAVVKIGGAPAPFAYCTAGTSTNGCVPSIGASGTASVAASSGFTLNVANVEGDKQGLLFYGLSGPVAFPWGPGGTSFNCVKSPTQRMPPRNSGGAAGTCAGALSTDWLAYLAGNPLALGNPIAAGTTVNAQGWYRDPPALKSTNLSNALEFVTVP
jgi:hypothetical protein